ncbi:hypothetical protein [Blastococcus sp. VKM Ac-2987]|nr:hypothetical protein [Blastococcus sp. VKM Ac-2987]MCZ2857892.1 hypothetical protein [Blastococcus sp. VKM Ac-2987]
MTSPDAAPPPAGRATERIEGSRVVPGEGPGTPGSGAQQYP